MGMRRKITETLLKWKQSDCSECALLIDGARRVAIAASLAVVLTLTALQSMADTPAEIEVVTGNLGTGEFTLRLPSSAKLLELYWAAAWADDTAEYSQWRDPVFLADVAAGTTEVNVTVPGFKADAASRFFLADPDNATVTRHESLVSGTDSNGNYNSAFVTGLHPNYDWKYEIVFDVPTFGSNQAWLFCHRRSSSGGDSIASFAIKTDKALRFGYATQNNVATLSSNISADVKYQAVFDKNNLIVSNLTSGASFGTMSATASSATFGTYNFWFGASSNGNAYNSNDKCSFARVYSFKAWNGSGELVCDFRPIVTNSVAGYFDLVTRAFFQSGDGVPANETNVFTPYVASATTLHIDTLVAHFGALVAVSSVLKAGPVECVSESIPFIKDSLPNYGTLNISVGESATFSVPTEEFLWADTANKTFYRVRSAGLRIDAYDATHESFVPGTPQSGLRSYTFTRQSVGDGVRVVCLWDAEMLADAPTGLRADCLRLVSVGTNAGSGKTEVGHGLCNTGVHPIPSATRVLCDVSLDHSSRTAQNNLSPVRERRFFGVRDESSHETYPAKYQYSFRINRVWSGNKWLDVGMCNYGDGSEKTSNQIDIGSKEAVRLQIDVNPEFTRVYDATAGVEHLAELRGNYVRSSEPLNGTLHIFGQHCPDDMSAPLCVDYNNTRYYSYTIWTNGVDLTRDYVPCLDATGRPSFYDRVEGNFIYPTGDKAEIVAEFGSYAVTNSVQVTGENEKGKPAAYFDPDATAPGYYKVTLGNSQTFTATERMVYGRKVTGYRIDTWEDGAGWVKGVEQSGRSVTLDGANSIRRVVWSWKTPGGTIIFLR